MDVKFCFGQLLGLPVREQELGERFIDDEWEEAKYLQILPPFFWIRLVKRVGFELKYFNTFLFTLRDGKGVGHWGTF